jgi:PPOX class probable F420-dependent enzyme
MTSFLLGPEALRVRAEHGPVVILDATVVLGKPRADGDHTSATGLPGWRDAHIPGSRHADLLHDLSDPGAGYHFARPSPEVLAARLASLGVRDGVPVVAYDRADGIWASRLWWLLDGLGVEAYVLDGGLAAWQSAGLPVASSPRVGLGSDSHPNSTHDEDSGLRVGLGSDSHPNSTRDGGSELRVGLGLESRPNSTRDGGSGLRVELGSGGARSGRWVERGDIEAWLRGDVAASVVCALNPEAFAGEVPTRYSRRGHIPGTANLPARSLIGPDGRFRPAPELRAILAGLLADPAPIWLYCGGGISATILGLALRELGRDDVAVYDGSLEEWSADPSLPIELGRTPARPAPAAQPALAVPPAPSAAAQTVPPSGALPAVELGAEVRELIDRPEFAVLSTVDPDGSAQLSVMWVGRDGDDLVMATRTGRRKVRNIERDPRVTVLIHDRRRPARYAEIRGVARVTGEDAYALVNELARRYTGADHVIADPARDTGRVVLRITPSTVRYRG